MVGVVYAIELNSLATTGLAMSEVKIGKTTDLESRLTNYQTGMMSEPDVLDLWCPNPDVSLASIEDGILDLAEQHAHERNGETFIFLQEGYQQFSETVDKLLETTTRDGLRDEPRREQETADDDDYAGKVPAVVRLNGNTYDVDTWTDCLVTVAEVVLRETENKEPLMKIQGRTRQYVVEDGGQSQLFSPKLVGDSGLYIETKFSANDIVRRCKGILEAYGYDRAEFGVFTE